jgi:hypothetical protein
MRISISVLDAYTYTPTVNAINKTLEVLGDKISKVYWFSDVDYTWEKKVETQWVKIRRMKNYQDDYKAISLKLIPHVCIEDYNLILHPDGFAVNRDAWTDEFLEYDYIGAAWGDGRVGNGGFSLRSRKLYDALLDLDVGLKSADYNHIIDNPDFHIINAEGVYEIPEDNVICKIYKSELETKYGIKFAPTHIANRFSVEHNYNHEWVGRSLGFHGKHGIAKQYGVEL